MRSLRNIAIILFLGSLSLFVSAQDLENSRSLFEQANTAYQEGKFTDALEIYKAIPDAHRNFAFHYNLGNVYYKLDSIGPCILHYERARRFDPRNEDLQVNLQLARQKVKDRIEALPSLGVKDLWSDLSSDKTLGRWTTLSLIGVFLAFAAFIVVVLSRKKQWKRVFALIGILALLLYIATYLMARKASERDNSNEAIIMAPRVEVKGSPNEEGTDVFILHEGTKVEIRSEQEEWLEIRIANGNVGWVRNGKCEMI